MYPAKPVMMLQTNGFQMHVDRDKTFVLLNMLLFTIFLLHCGIKQPVENVILLPSGTLIVTSQPSGATIFIDDVNTKEVSVATLSRKVGYVFQNPDHQLFSETVKEEIAFALKNFGYKEKTINERVDWALNLLDLTEYCDVSPFMLSGGERKRVALASVLAWDPKIIILDEPTIGQDNQQKEKLLQFIIQLKKQGKTVIIVTHDIEFVAESKPRVMLMTKGKIIGEGDAEKILTDEILINKASVALPEIANTIKKLNNKSLSSNIIDVYQASKIIIERFRECS